MAAYYQSEDLKKLGDVSQGAPELWDHFQRWYGDVFKDGALTGREKALIALAVANLIQCPYCIEVYTRNCQETGSNLEQMTEALHVAAALKAGAVLAHGVQLKAVHDRLSM
ncbi:MAG: arsenosugar biosynthesis-associated peroxidase-like protein [Isosphaeraceae bacterium]